MVHCFAKSYRISAVFWLVSTQFYVLPAIAQDDLSVINYVPNFVTVNYGRDNDHGRDTFLFANLGLTLKDRLLVALGEQVETVTGSEEDLDNNTYLLGYNYIPSYKAQFGAEYEFWGDRSKITIDSLKAILSFNFATYSLSFTPEYREINVDNDSQCDEGIYGSSAKVNVGIDINPQFTFSMGYSVFDYSSNLTEISQCVSSAESLEVQSRIDSVAFDKEMSMGIDIYHKTETYGGSVSHAKTALNNLSTKTISLFASTDKFDDWTLTATGGIVENTDDSTTLFLSGTISYYW